MAGKVIRVLPMRKFVFTNVGTGDTQKVLIADGIDVSGYTSGELVARLHSGSSIDQGDPPTKASVVVYQDCPTPEDPASAFQGGSIATAEFDKDDAASAPEPSVVAMENNPLGNFIGVTVEGTQETTGTTFEVILSADLVLRE
jgi:hypothetical protein